MSVKSRITNIDKGSMKKILGVGDLFAVGYGDLGSSIYYALGITALFALGATPIALALAGLVFACTALTYAEMSSMMKDSGGSATYSRHAFNDLISFIAGWGLLLDYIVTIAISSYSVAPYLAYFFKALNVNNTKIIFAVLVVASLFVINFFGTKHSTRISWFLTMLTVVTQVTIVIIGSVYLVKLPELFKHMRIGVDSSWSPTWPQFFKGVAMAMVAYTGIESMAQLSSEAKNPAKTVPRAIMYAMGTLLFVYLGISVVSLAAISPQELSTKYLEDPIAGIVSVLPFGGQALGAWVGLLAAVILFVAANAGLIGASRLCFNMGENYQIPRFVYKLHKKHKTPYVALGIFACLAGLIIFWSRGKLAFLADLYNFGAMLAFFSAHLSLLMLRIRQKDAVRPFRVPFNIKIRGYSFPISAILGCVVTLAVWILVVVTKPDGRWLGLAWIGLGLVMYFTYRRKHKIAPAGKLQIEKIKIPDFKTLSIRKILVPTRGGTETETVQIACEIAKAHGADVTAINIIEVPFSMPLDLPLSQRSGIADSILKRADAISREYHIKMELKVMQSRSIDKSISEMLRNEEFDLLVLGAQLPTHGGSVVKGFGALTEKILRDAPCRVWVCCHREKLNS